MTGGELWREVRGHPALRALTDLAGESGQDLWLCGGTLRDLLLGRRPPDLDLAVDGDAMALGRALAQRTGSRFVPLGREFATCRVVTGRGELDLAGLRAPTLTADLAARDFTVNALALPLDKLCSDDPEAHLVDPTGGRADLAAGLLRPAGPGVLCADPLRVLRAFRFMATHALAPAPGLEYRLAGAAPGLFRVAAERIGAEWLKLMAGPQAVRAVEAMEDCGVLTRLAPELAAGRGLPQNPYHHLDVLGHSLACARAAGLLTAGRGPLAGTLAQEGPGYLREPRRRALFMTAALLHDLGKPPTRQAKDEVWATFYRHEIMGAKLASGRCRALGLSKADASWVGRLVAEHMRPFHLLGAQGRGQLTRRGVRRMLAALGPDLPALFMLAMADTIAGRGPLRPPEAEGRLLALYQEVARLRDRELAAALAAPPLLDGHELMQVLGLPTGKEVGRLLTLVREAQLDGEISSKDEALALAREAHSQSFS
ncbi:MAG: HD domain-containing protein [Proteobacteria bacterium]|nr:HD domain-containing protein [Pseudomonadota bacterium]MBU4599105.1 HD domain-containing protein [Pseudomonadota bacterium]MBV1714842.1 HD domain-containing protein [Desulfarculus sp.]MBV1753122.1 HD domain-containing protein [Desulfarculus sp.]